MFKKKIPLTSFVLEITSHCNHACQYCYNVWKCHNGDYPMGNELSTEQIKTILDQLHRETNIRYLAISGGEPLLRGDTLEIVAYCRHLGIGANLLTNGSLLTEDLCQDAVKAGVSIFEVPFLTLNEGIHHLLTGRDDLPVVIEGIKNVKKHRGTLVTVFVATKMNIPYIKETLEMAIALGTDGMMFNRFNPGGAGITKRDELMPSLTEIKDALRIYDQMAGYYGVKSSVSVPIPKCLVNPKDYRHIRFGYCPSGNRKSYFTIDPFGNVRVCNHTPSIIGNLLEEDFGQLFLHPSITAFQKAHSSHCQNCRDLKRCWGGCKASAQVCMGDWDQTDPFLAANV